MSGEPIRIPPMDPDTDEASERQLEAARRQGDSYGHALELMTGSIATTGGQQRAGEYLIAYAVEDAEGMYLMTPRGLCWEEPGHGSVHLEVAVRDGADGRFVPGLRVTATLAGPDGDDLGTHELPMLWHPMLLHYGCNVPVPTDGVHSLRVHVDPAPFPRHDRVNGRRFTEPVETTFAAVEIRTGGA